MDAHANANADASVSIIALCKCFSCELKRMLDGWMDGHKNKPKAICPPQLFKFGGLKTKAT